MLIVYAKGITNALVSFRRIVLRSVRLSGNSEGQIILSVRRIDRTKLDTLNFDLLTPSNSMVNFSFNMSFNKKAGFNAVEELSIS